jgi:hypothetical protein
MVEVKRRMPSLNPWKLVVKTPLHVNERTIALRIGKEYRQMKKSGII